MAVSSKIKVMISSRCNDKFPLDEPKARKLTDIRASLKEEIQSISVFGKHVYEVWINEKAVTDGDANSWEECTKQASDCDIFVALFNGNAGWLGTGGHGTIGICHAEFMQANNTAPGKLFIVNIHEPSAKSAPKKPADELFQSYVKRLDRFDARAAKSEAQLISAIKETIVYSTIRLVQRGVRDASRGRSYLGPALDWTRLDYAERSGAMKRTAWLALTGEPNFTSAAGDGTFAERKVKSQNVLFWISAIPDAMTVPAAREMVGQPHLEDHTQNKRLSRCHGGPVHLIVCHKAVTEPQATKMLGFPKASVVKAPFGIYLVDPVQGIQLAFISECRDDTSTRHGVQRFLEWLDEAEQAAQLIQHARKRKAIVKVIAGV